MVYKEEPPPSDSSDEPFTFNLTQEQEGRIHAKRVRELRLIEERRKLTSRERL